MDRRAWLATNHGVAKRLSDFSFHPSAVPPLALPGSPLSQWDRTKPLTGLPLFTTPCELVVFL